MWLVQLPALVDEEELETLQRKVQGATRERMLRELAEALEVISAERPLVLWLEDLHWSDVSTLDLLASLARRKEPARLLVIGTYRPVEMLHEGHPLKGVTQELYTHKLCIELPLPLLTEAAIASYLDKRFPHSALPVRLAQLLHERTEGNPLFLTSLIDEWVAQGVLSEGDGGWMLHREIASIEEQVPGSIRRIVARQQERLRAEEQRMLQAASVAGVEFATAAAAAALEKESAEVEEQCTKLTERQQFLRPAGIAEWPDGTRTARYGFRHAVYQHLWHEQVGVERRQQWHLRIGKRLEAAYGEQAQEIATELAMHFEQGRDYRRAVRYLQQAGENAVRRSAHQEAISLLAKGLELLKALSNSPERVRYELVLQNTIGLALIAIKGYGAPEVEHAYTRARELGRQVGETPQLFPILRGLSLFYTIRAEFQTALELAEQCLRLAQSTQDPALLVEAHYVLGMDLVHLGEFVSARPHLEQAIALYDPQRHSSHHSVQDPGVVCLAYEALALWMLGYPDQALSSVHEALTLAQKLGRPFSLAFALHWVANLHKYRREAQAAQERVMAAVTLSTDQGFPFWLAVGAMVRGWALVEQGQGKEGMAQIYQGLAIHQATGAELARPHYLALLAEAYGIMGQTEEGLTAVAEALALVHKTGECCYEAELYRLKGQLVLQQFEVTNPQFPTPNPQAEAEAEAYFLKAIEVTRRQQAKSWELRASTSLARLWQQQGKKEEARQTLVEIYGWFTEGFDTKDLQEANALLKELA
jgi:predicted ATPase